MHTITKSANKIVKSLGAVTVNKNGVEQWVANYQILTFLVKCILFITIQYN